MTNRKTLNYKVLLVFAPVLILTGIAGFILPAQKSLTSGAPAYNLFHIFFGVLGLMLVLIRNEGLIRAFNIGFGIIDIYQAVASFTHLFPQTLFRWTAVDDGLHIVIGAALIGVGLYGRKKSFT
ncbi:MAG: hypothetical protein ABR577_04480 [Pyrinomonadaceae bacterium]